MPRAAVALLAGLLLVASLPTIDARNPLPETASVAKETVKTSLRETDHDGAKLLKQAQRLLGRVPRLQDAGELEVRARLTQPGLASEDALLAAVWVGAREGVWRGAWWAESDAGAATPNALMLDATGVLLLVDGGALAQRDAVRLRVHFAGADGSITTVDLGDIALLAGVPELGRVDAGGAVASARGEALLLTPWNLVGEPVAMGFRVVAQDGATLSDWQVGGCDDPTLPETEHGCRPLYAVPWPADAARVELWRVEDGARVVDATLDAETLIAGYMFG